MTDLDTYLKKENIKITTTLAADTDINGILKFDNPLRIEGKFKGEIIATNTLVLGTGAQVDANIKAKRVIIAGSLKGDVEALEKLEILPTGKLYGNIKTAKLKIADGVIFEGNCEMINYQKPKAGSIEQLSEKK